MKRILFIAAVAVVTFSSCKKNNGSPYNSNIKADLSVEFDNIAGSSDLQLNTGTYTNSSGEEFSVTKLKYYASNFLLTNVNGTVYTVPQDSCYFLIDEADEDTHEPVLHVPEGEYKTLQFTVGVDSIRNTMDISRRTGVLDPTGAGADMYWGWNSGYIFFKMEGTSPASPTGDFMYHIGGFGGYSSATINNIKTLTFDLTQRGAPQVKAGKETNIHMMIDVTKMFSGAHTISIAANPMVMFDPYSTNIADNFTDMFKHDHTEN
ncbi:MAG TPA: MbnP family protein [Parafilimonas sp.]|nr:MbnP family protein [Parafilimonas sp.]